MGLTLKPKLYSVPVDVGLDVRWRVIVNHHVDARDVHSCRTHRKHGSARGGFVRGTPTHTQNRNTPYKDVYNRTYIFANGGTTS